MEPLTLEDYSDIYLENFIGLNLNQPKDYKRSEPTTFWEWMKEKENNDQNRICQ